MFLSDDGEQVRQPAKDREARSLGYLGSAADRAAARPDIRGELVGPDGTHMIDCRVYSTLCSLGPSTVAWFSLDVCVCDSSAPPCFWLVSGSFLARWWAGSCDQRRAAGLCISDAAAGQHCALGAGARRRSHRRRPHPRTHQRYARVARKTASYFPSELIPPRQLCSSFTLCLIYFGA
jgi:hypothetical protein